ncbi:hypothetical protein DNU06_04045 [Putridiphycobacter roseus]|uniref:DUF306 domain-containing protein n=1 Tax=Putridiphycobacter roseus TaxID=2219161 RepID=A0A2W1MZY3_9FLAO|nr:copper resistance protein NlpE N-terminal domain-containing protein [Putridiphycobacter roseus]PZE17799.1 hypothetical protein DNU06_04045 [Putridiphycobacter roseus]
MKFTKLILVALLIHSITSCANQKSTIDMHDNENSLDWQGSYSGTLPCEDCEGIYTTLQLKGNQTYILTTTYLGGENETAIENGEFDWKEDGKTLVLMGEEGKENNLYQVLENKILKLDAEGEKNVDTQSANYTLHKLGSQFTDTYWKLIEFQGQKITNEMATHEVYIQFNTLDNQVIGNGGCNNFYGNYMNNQPSEIKLNDIVITEMTCVKPGIENKLMQVLNSIDNYSIENGILSLSKAKMATEAKFEAKLKP